MDRADFSFKLVARGGTRAGGLVVPLCIPYFGKLVRLIAATARVGLYFSLALLNLPKGCLQPSLSCYNFVIL